jgi:hypothetical protein
MRRGATLRAFYLPQLGTWSSLDYPSTVIEIAGCGTNSVPSTVRRDA